MHIIVLGYLRNKIFYFIKLLNSATKIINKWPIKLDSTAFIPENNI